MGVGLGLQRRGCKVGRRLSNRLRESCIDSALKGERRAGAGGCARMQAGRTRLAEQTEGEAVAAAAAADTQALELQVCGLGPREGGEGGGVWVDREQH